MKKLLLLVLFSAISISAWSVGERYLKTNTLIVGLNTAGDILIEADQGGANNPALKYDSTESKWVKSDDGVDFGNLGGGVGSASVFRLVNADDDTAAFKTGFTTSGSGTLSVETVAPLNGDKSYKYAPSAVSENTLSATIPMPQRTTDIAGVASIGVSFVYDATDDGFTIQIEDQAGNVLSKVLEIDSTKNRANLRFNLKGTETDLKFRINVASYVASMAVVFDDMAYDDNPDRKLQIQYVNSLGLSGNDGRALAANTEDIPWNGSGPGVGWTAGADNQPSYYTVQRSDSIITLNGTRYATQDNDDTLSLYVNGISVSRVLSSPIPTLRSQITKFQYDSYRGEFQAGDKLSIRGPIGRTLNTLNGAVVHFLNINETAQDESIVLEGAPGSEWTEYPMTIGATTTAPTKATTVIQDYAKYRQVGDSMEIEYYYLHTNNAGATAGVGDYLFSIPPGFLIDTAKVIANSGTTHVGSIVGNGTSAGSITNNTRNAEPGTVSVYDSTTMRLNTYVGSTRVNLWVGQGHDNFTSAIYRVSLRVTVPILGWGETKAHIVPIADPYENTYSAHIQGSANTNNLDIVTVLSSSSDFIKEVVHDSLTASWLVKWKVGHFTVPPSVLGTVEMNIAAYGRILVVDYVNTTEARILISNSGTAEDNDFHLMVQRQGADYKEPKGYFLGEIATNRSVEMILGSDAISTGDIASFARTDLTVGKFYRVSGSLHTDSASNLKGDFLNGATDISFLMNNGGAGQSKSISFEFIAVSTDFDLNLTVAGAADKVKGNATRGEGGSYLRITEINTDRSVGSF